MRAPPAPVDAADAARPRPAIGVRSITLIGLGGAIALSWAAWRVGALPDRRFRLRWLDGVPVLGSVPLPSRALAYVVWAVGLALLSGAWILLRRRTVERHHGLTVG